jgi:hypothetical protein
MPEYYSDHSLSFPFSPEQLSAYIGHLSTCKWSDDSPQLSQPMPPKNPTSIEKVASIVDKQEVKDESKSDGFLTGMSCLCTMQY